GGAGAVKKQGDATAGTAAQRRAGQPALARVNRHFLPRDRRDGRLHAHIVIDRQDAIAVVAGDDHAERQHDRRKSQLTHMRVSYNALPYRDHEVTNARRCTKRTHTHMCLRAASSLRLFVVPAVRAHTRKGALMRYARYALAAALMVTPVVAQDVQPTNDAPNPYTTVKDYF